MRFSPQRLAQCDFLHREIAARLIDHLTPLTLTPAHIVDIGAGLGHDEIPLKSHYPNAQYWAIEHADIPSTSNARVRARSDALPFATASIDLIYANLSLHWADAVAQLKEWRRVLKADGVVIFSCYGPTSFNEYRTAWQATGYDYATPRLIDLHDLGDALLSEGFIAPVMEMELLQLDYQETPQLIKDIRTLIGPPDSRIAGVKAKPWSEQKKALRLLRSTTVEIVYGHAFAPFSMSDLASTKYVIPITPLRGAAK